MPDPRSVMKEYRYLDEKRLAEGLTPEEDARYGRLRDLVVPETGAAPTGGKPGFDVGAAAEKLRESLLPAGLRSRPPPVPDVAEPLLEPGPPPFDATQPGIAADAQPFDPAAGAWDPNAQPFDPGDQAYDPSAAAFDPAAQGYDVNAQAFDPAAQAWDPNAEFFDPAAQGWDPNAQPFDPAAQAWDPNAQPFDPAAQAWDPNAQPFDPAAQAYDPNTQPLELDPSAQAEWDPDANPKAWTGGDAAPLPPEGWDAAAPPLEPPAPGVALGDYDGDAAAFAPLDLGGSDALPFDAAAESALPPGNVPEAYAAPLGEYDDSVGFATPPFDASDVPPDAPGLDLAGAPALELDAAALPDSAAAADPAAGGEEPFRLASAGSFSSDGEPPPAPEDSPAAPWDHAAPVDIAGVDEPPLGEASGYEIAPLPPAEIGLDFSRPDFSMPDPDAAEVAEVAFADAEVELVPAPEGDATAPAGGDAALDFDVQTVEEVPTVGEVPTVEGADVLEEIHELDAAPPPRSLDFEPLIPPPPAAAPSEPAAAPSAPVEAAPAALEATPRAAGAVPSFRVGGSHRVVVHTVEGQVKRGVLEDPDLGGPSLALAIQPGGATEAVATEKVKAIFFMLSPGESPPAPEGGKVRVTFRDGRQVAGFSGDYDETRIGFFVVPGDARTNTGRIWVYRSAVRQVTVS